MRSTESRQATAKALSAFVIRLEGEFDVAEQERLTDAFSIATSAPLVVLDLEKTDFIDSSILRCIAQLRTDTHQRGAELVLVGLNSQVSRLFEVTQLDRIFTIRRSMAEAPEVDGDSLRRLTIQSRPIRGSLDESAANDAGYLLDRSQEQATELHQRRSAGLLDSGDRVVARNSARLMTRTP